MRILIFILLFSSALTVALAQQAAVGSEQAKNISIEQLNQTTDLGIEGSGDYALR
jgi:hypothetical protein